MKGITILTFVLTVICASALPVLSQEKAKWSDYKVMRDDSSYDGGITTHFFDYEFKGVPVKTIEKYFKGIEEQNNGLIDATRLHEGCGMPGDLFNGTGKSVGKKVTCESRLSKKFVIIYAYFNSLNKVNIIWAESRKIVEDFTKGICPYAYHLYGDLGCQHFDD